VVDGIFASQFLTTSFLQRLDIFRFFRKNRRRCNAWQRRHSAGRCCAHEITLPYMSGIDLLKKLKQDPRTAGIPVWSYVTAGPGTSTGLRTGRCSGYLVQRFLDTRSIEAIRLHGASPRSFLGYPSALDVIVSTGGMPGNEYRGQSHGDIRKSAST